MLFTDSSVYPAQTMWQPYAGLAELGLKTIETRRTRTSLRGYLVICAGHEVDREALCRIRTELVGSGRVSAERFDLVTSRRGVAVAVGRVVNCRRLVESDRARSFWWDEKEPRWAWEIEDMRALTPFRVRAMPGFFSILQTDVHEALLA